MDKEQILQLKMIEQEAEQLNQQSQMIEQNIGEMIELKESLNEIEKKENEEILVNIGKRVYLPVRITERKLIVEIGNKNHVKKSIGETRELVESQLEKLNSAKDQILMRLEEIDREMNNIIRKIQETPEKEGK